MTRSPKWSPRIAVLVTTAALLFAACGASTASTAPSSAAPASEAPASEAPASASAEAFTPMVYPESGEAPCGQAAAPDATHDKYGGEFKKITAVDAKTVVFDLCNPDVAFLSKIAFSSFAINDSAWLQSHVDPAKPVTHLRDRRRCVIQVRLHVRPARDCQAHQVQRRSGLRVGKHRSDADGATAPVGLTRLAFRQSAPFQSVRSNGSLIPRRVRNSSTAC